MPSNQVPCEPLIFEVVFLKLLADMDVQIHRLAKEPPRDKLIRDKLIRYQTIMAAGGYLGLRAKELLHLSWFDLIDKTENTIFQFKTKSKRKVYFAPSFIKIIERNFLSIEPVNIHHLVLHKQTNPMEAISTNQFNLSLGTYLKRFKVDTPTPSSHTLRKTHMQEAWHQLGRDDRAYMSVAKMMNYKSINQVMHYLGHTEREIKEAVLRFK